MFPTRHLLPLLGRVLSLSLSLAVSVRAENLAVPPVAVARIATPVVTVAPDRADWTYAPGDEVSFTVRVLADGAPWPGAEIAYMVGPEKFEGEKVTAIVPAEGLRISAGTLNAPGFLRCRVEFSHGGSTHRALATAAFTPEAIEPTQAEPADFDAFWSGYLERLARIPARVLKERVPEACTPEVDVYRISFDAWNFGDRPMRFYGVLTEPTAPGPHPAVLRVPGAGVRPYEGEVELAARGFIVLQIGIHGIPIHLPPELYENLRTGGLNVYPTNGIDSPDTYYYLRVYLACVRANDVLVAHERWDGKTLLATGGSQGGQLTVVTAALDPRVTGSVANYPAYCDVTGYVAERAGGWPGMMAREEHRTAERLRTTSYFDVVNFARRLRAPISFAWGYNDEVCPPTSMFAAYNVVSAPKQLEVQLEMGHRSSDAFAARFVERIVEMAR